MALEDVGLEMLEKIAEDAHNAKAQDLASQDKDIWNEVEDIANKILEKVKEWVKNKGTLQCSSTTVKVTCVFSF